MRRSVRSITDRSCAYAQAGFSCMYSIFGRPSVGVVWGRLCYMLEESARRSDPTNQEATYTPAVYHKKKHTHTHTVLCFNRTETDVFSLVSRLARSMLLIKAHTHTQQTHSPRSWPIEAFSAFSRTETEVFSFDSRIARSML